MVEHAFDFDRGYQGWEPGFADHPPGPLDSFELVHEERELPISAGRGRALFISGMNRSDDLFMFHKRKISGLDPGRRYDITFGLAFASKYISQAGIGGDPARSVYVKACASSFEPVHVEAEGAVRLNIDIGRQSNPGSNSVVLGDVEKPRDDTENYVVIERASKTPLACKADSQGSLWLLFGTDSGYEGETSLYYTRFNAALT